MSEMSIVAEETLKEITYTSEEAKKHTLEYFDGDMLATSVFLDKYALKNVDGEFLEKDPSDMHRRIAREFARIEKQKFKNPLDEKFIFSLLDKFKFLVPQGSPMYGIGNNNQIISLSNCFVVDSPADSYGGICNCDQNLAQISKRRGGVGLDISHLRPDGAVTHNASRTSTGIIPFMERFSNTIREVGQAGRRGALMITIDVHHPQVEEFAKIKNDETKVTGANISIKLSDEFLKAVENDTDVELRWPVNSDNPEISKMVNAKELWKTIIHSAWFRAEPGLLFWDNVINNSPADCYSDVGFKTLSTNPCSEIPLSAYDSCRLLAMNLYSYVNYPFTDYAEFNYSLFYDHAQLAQRMMDNLIDLEIEKIDAIIEKIEMDPEDDIIKHNESILWKNIRNACIKGRRTGLGITALGDTLAALGIRYGSDASIDVAEEIYKTLKLGAYRSSVDMAREIGHFPVWKHEKEINNPFISQLKIEDPELYDDMQKYGRRNIALLTIAPTGSLSILTQTTSGVEPLYLTGFLRKRKINPNDTDSRVDYTDQNGDKWQEYTVYHNKINEWMNITNKSDVKESPWYNSCAPDIDWNQRVKLQSAMQRHCDHAISSTVNLPNDVTQETVAEIYETAWKSGCKGITVYRDGCRTGVLSAESMKDKSDKEEWKKRPKTVESEIYHTSVKGDKYFVFVGMLDNEPYEVFAGKDSDDVNIPKKYTMANVTKVKRGHYRATVGDTIIMENIADKVDDEQAALCRLISMSMRHDIPLQHLVHQLEKVPGHLLSYSKAISRILKKYIADGTEVSGEDCPQCVEEGKKGLLIRQEGCVTCRECGYSKCA